MNSGSKMRGDGHFRRIDTIELKLQIEIRVGRQKTEQYFNLLNKYLSLKISKPDFDKLCIGLLGKESVTLHNGLIRSIIRNAHLSKSPPPNGKTSSSNVKVQNKYQQNGGAHNVGYHEQQSATELLSLGSRPPVEVTSVEEGEEIEQSPGIHSRSPVTAPIGVSLKAKGKKDILPNGSSLSLETCYNNGELPDSTSLRKRLVQKLETEGLNVETACVNLLNNGLDVFLKRLMKPCLDLASERKVSNKVTSYINGTRPVTYVQNSNRLFLVSTTDFGVAIESNPHVLGEDGSTQLEKVWYASKE